MKCLLDCLGVVVAVLLLAGMTLEQVQNSGDAQFLRALELLNQSADRQSAQR